jgi:hypothetical protein
MKRGRRRRRKAAPTLRRGPGPAAWLRASRARPPLQAKGDRLGPFGYAQGKRRPLQRRRKRKRPRTRVRGLWNLIRRRPTFPHSYPCSIIGPARLNFRVRDGNGCDPRGMTTGNLEKLAALAISVISNRISVREERSCASEVFGKDWRGATRAPRTTVLVGEYKFGPLPNNYCVLQDVADWSRNQPAMNSSRALLKPFVAEERSSGCRTLSERRLE